MILPELLVVVIAGCLLGLLSSVLFENMVGNQPALVVLAIQVPLFVAGYLVLTEIESTTNQVIGVILFVVMFLFIKHKPLT